MSQAIVAASRWGGAFWRDFGERVGVTLVYSLITLVTMDNILEGPDFDTVLWPIVVLPVVLSALKGLLANFKDYESGASLLNAPPGPVLTDDGNGGGIRARGDLGAGEARLILIIVAALLIAWLLWTLFARV